MIKKKIKRYIKKKFPKFVKIYKILIQKNNDVSFEGWGMTTLSTNNPWEKKIQEGDSFRIFLENVLNDINSKKRGNWFKNLKNTYIDYLCLSNEIKKWRER